MSFRNTTCDDLVRSWDASILMILFTRFVLQVSVTRTKRFWPLSDLLINWEMNQRAIISSTGVVTDKIKWNCYLASNQLAWLSKCTSKTTYHILCTQFPQIVCFFLFLTNDNIYWCRLENNKLKWLKWNKNAWNWSLKNLHIWKTIYLH